MKNENTIGKLEYILEHVLWMGLAMFWFKRLFFANLPYQGIDSKSFLWLITLLAVALGCSVTFRKRRNNVSLIVNILFPYELYTIFSYSVRMPRLVWGTVALSCAISVAFFLLAITPDKRLKVGFDRRLKHGLLGAKTLMAFCLLALMLPIGIRNAIGNGTTSTALSEGSVETNSSDNAEWTIARQIDTVRLLQEEHWSKLDTREKLDVLDVILKIETNYLGLNHSLSLKSADLERHTLAEYDHFSKEIVVDIDHLQSNPSKDVLNSLCHECFHSYQYQMIDLYNRTDKEYHDMLLFEYVDDYLKEFSDYEDGTNDIDAYYNQVSEITARQYAAKAVDAYHRRIEEFAN